MMSAQNSSGLAPQRLMMFEHSSSSLGLHCQKMFKQISSNLVSQMSQRRLLASLQAPFLKEKKVYASCALSSKERKSSWFLIILINSVIFVHARSVVCGSVDHCFTKLKKKLCARRRDSFIVSKKRSSDSTKKFKGVPDESTISLEASNVKNGSKTGVPDEEKLNLEWEGRFSSSVPLLILQSSISHLLNQYLLHVKNHSLQLSPPTSALQQSSSVFEMVKSRLLCKSVQDLCLLDDPGLHQAFTTSANVPSIYIQLFWNTLTHDAKTGVYSFQVDEHWLTLSADLLRKALNVTPADSAHPFESPPAGKTDITFTRRRVPSNWLMKMKFNRLLNLIWMIMSTIYNKTTRKLPVVEVKGKGSATDRWIIASQDETTGPSVHPEDATSTKMVRETLSHADAESGGNSEKINSETDTEILNVGSNSEQSHVALAGPNPEHMHDVFLATNYPKVHESLKHTTKEHVHLENPPSSSRTLSSMKNLEDNFTFGDQVINDKSQEDELGKTTVESEVESMVIVPIQQASSSAPPLNTHVIDLSSPKPVSPSCQEPFITTSTTNTRTTTEQNRS
ncbi:hypothetical protein Tco_0657329 [Tanacetum coccineum]|uniref:Uncharacterized protein n=1 Tax=Tanacetum coccineum TaxID=301880 RepID=A0ABQ4XCF7_9ASTR